MAFTREVPAGSGCIMRYSQGARRTTQFSLSYSMERWVGKLSLRGLAVTIQCVDPKILGVSTEHSNIPCKYQLGPYESNASNRFKRESLDLKYSDTRISRISNFLLHCSLIRVCLSVS